MNLEDFIKLENNKYYFKKMEQFLIKERTNNNIFPILKHTYRALKIELNKIKVIIVGQDPYPNSLASGFAFSTHNQNITYSLSKIYYELKRSVKNFIIPKHGSLRWWVHQGVVLLNSILTVEYNKPLSHNNIGWNVFTNKLIKFIDNNCDNVVFMLWGNIAKQKKYIIINKKNLLLISNHPVNNNFIGNNHFVLANKFFNKNNKKIIDWNIK